MEEGADEDFYEFDYQDDNQDNFINYIQIDNKELKLFEYCDENDYDNFIKLFIEIENPNWINNDNEDKCTIFWYSCYNNKLNFVKFLYEQGVDIEIPNINQLSPFNMACLGGCYEIAEYLLDKANLESKEKLQNTGIYYYNK